MTASMQTKTKVVLVEDHPIVREMMSQMLSNQDDFEIIATADSIAESKAITARMHPDLVVLDVELSDGSGIDLAKELKLEYPDLKIIFLTAYKDAATVLSAINTEAEGYIVKSVSCKRLLDAIRTVAMGGYAFDPSVVAPLLRQMATMSPSIEDCNRNYDFRMLSMREKDIASLAIRGMTNKEIADATFVTVNTVKTHLRRIYQRLGISSRRQLPLVACSS